MNWNAWCSCLHCFREVWKWMMPFWQCSTVHQPVRLISTMWPTSAKCTLEGKNFPCWNAWTIFAAVHQYTKLFCFHKNRTANSPAMLLSCFHLFLCTFLHIAPEASLQDLLWWLVRKWWIILPSSISSCLATAWLWPGLHWQLAFFPARNNRMESPESSTNLILRNSKGRPAPNSWMKCFAVSGLRCSMWICPWVMYALEKLVLGWFCTPLAKRKLLKRRPLAVSKILWHNFRQTCEDTFLLRQPMKFLAAVAPQIL